MIQSVLKKLHDHNIQEENWKIREYAPKSRSKKEDDESKKDELHEWGGGMARREIQAIYLISFFCLLRSDEVLKIRREHLVLNRDDPAHPTVTLTLPFRKTHQDGGKFNYLTVMT